MGGRGSGRLPRYADAQLDKAVRDLGPNGAARYLGIHRATVYRYLARQKKTKAGEGVNGDG